MGPRVQYFSVGVLGHFSPIGDVHHRYWGGGVGCCIPLTRREGRMDGGKERSNRGRVGEMDIDGEGMSIESKKKGRGRKIEVFDIP